MTSETLVLDVVIPVYNGWPRVGDVVDSILRQNVDKGWMLNVVIVDDCSTDNGMSALENKFGGQITIVSHEVNKGRAASRNTGARHGTGHYILFLDCDCVPISEDMVSWHLRSIKAGARISCGVISVTGSDFWSRYQRKVSGRRYQKIKLRPEDVPDCTTANTVIGRGDFEKAGGFNENYSHYGFEDRDLLIRLRDIGALVSVSREAVVSHNTDLSMRTVSWKMHEAGKYSSGLLRSDHPMAYSSMRYSKFDVSLHPALRPVAFFLSLFLPLLVKCIDSKVLGRWLPDVVRSFGVAGVSAISYLVGTARQDLPKSQM